MDTKQIRSAVFATGAAAAAIITAPPIAAAPTPLGDCVVTVAGSTCRSPGNVEVNNPRPAVSVLPYGMMPFLRGGR